VAELLQRKESMIDIESSTLPELLDANHHAAEKQVQLAINLSVITPPQQPLECIFCAKQRMGTKELMGPKVNG
jgi:hypothetical protein